MWLTLETKRALSVSSGSKTKGSASYCKLRDAASRNFKSRLRLPVILQADFELANRFIRCPKRLYSVATEIVRGMFEMLSGMT